MLKTATPKASDIIRQGYPTKGKSRIGDATHYTNFLLMMDDGRIQVFTKIASAPVLRRMHLKKQNVERLS